MLRLTVKTVSPGKGNLSLKFFDGRQTEVRPRLELLGPMVNAYNCSLPFETNTNMRVQRF